MIKSRSFYLKKPLPKIKSRIMKLTKIKIKTALLYLYESFPTFMADAHYHFPKRSVIKLLHMYAQPKNRLATQRHKRITPVGIKSEGSIHSFYCLITDGKWLWEKRWYPLAATALAKMFEEMQKEVKKKYGIKHEYYTESKQLNLEEYEKMAKFVKKIVG